MIIYIVACCVSYHSRGFLCGLSTCDKSCMNCPHVVSLALCKCHARCHVSSGSWKFLFPHEILRGTMCGHTCKCKVINERYCICNMITLSFLILHCEIQSHALLINDNHKLTHKYDTAQLKLDTRS